MKNQKKQLFISFPCWGEAHLKGALDCVIPSLLSDGNIKFIANNNVDIIFQFISDEESYHSFKRTALFKELKNYCVIEFFDINKIAPLTLKNSEKLIFSHNFTYEKASISESFAFFCCADIVFSNNAIKYLWQILAKGYEVVLASALRVNYESTHRCLSNLITASLNSLSAKRLTELALNNLHKDELGMTQGGDFMTEGWSSNLMWYEKSKALIRIGIYHCPFILKTKKNKNFGNASFDNTPLFNDYLEHWNESVFIVQDVENCVALDLTFERYHILGLTNIKGTEKAINRERYTAAAMVVNPCQSWHFKTLQYPIVYRTEQADDQLVECLLNRAEKYTQQVEYWISYYRNSSKYLFDTPKYLELKGRMEHFGGKYINFPSVYERVNSFISQANLNNENIILYGMGELLSYVDENVVLPVSKVYLTDSDQEKVTKGYKNFTSIDVDSIDKYANKVIVLSLKFKDEIRQSLKQKFPNLIIEDIGAEIIKV